MTFLTGALWLAALHLCYGGGVFLAPAQPVPAADPNAYLVRSWQVEQGLPNNTINAIAQTRDGYLWLGTDQGLVRFDGHRCRPFGFDEGLDSLEISALLEDSRGQLWIGSAGGGLSVLTHGKIKTFGRADGLVGNSIKALVEDNAGAVWVATPTGLCQYRQGRFERVAPELKSLFVYDLAKDRQGDVWAATLHDGLLRFHHGTALPVEGLAPLGDIKARSVFVDDQDRVWVGSRDKYLLSLENGKWTRYGTNEGFPEVVTSHLAQSSDHTLWVGTIDGGIYHLRDGKFVRLPPRSGLPDHVILSLFGDRKGFLWAGTRSGGLCRIGPQTLAVHPLSSGGFESQLRSLATTTNGELYAGTYGQGLFRWQDAHFEPVTRPREVTEHLFVEALLGARDGSLWWGAGPALYQMRQGELASFYLDTPWLVADRVWCLCEARAGGIWVGTFNGNLGILRAGQFTPIDHLPGHPVTSLVEASDETLWIGFLGGGLGCYQKGKLTLFSKKDGLSSNSIRAMLQGDDGVLWLGTQGGGLIRLFKGRFDNIHLKPDIADDTVLQILSDDGAHLWLGGTRGIFRFNKQELTRLRDGSELTVHPRMFGQSEGMLSKACVPNFGAALKTPTGNLCFSTPKGLVVIDPKRVSQRTAQPPVVLEEFLVDGQAIDSTGAAGVEPFEIMPGDHHFEFHFTAINYDSPERLCFEYQLEGLDGTWTEAGQERVARYSSLPPGTYRFRVRLSNDNEFLTPLPAEFAFEVEPRFWQSLGFKALVLLVGLGLMGRGFHLMERRRQRARLKRLEAEHAMEAERSRIARDLHDEIGSSLTNISLSINRLVRSRETTMEELKARIEKISHFAVRTARSLDEIVWAVNPGNDTLPNLVDYLLQSVRELVEEAGVRCRFQIAETLPACPLPPEMRHNLFLAVKEAVNNALKHARATEIRLSVQTEGRQLRISVADDGVGFDDGSAGGGMEQDGLANMQQRIESLGGRMTVQTRPGEGTVVTFCVQQPEAVVPVG